MNDIEIALAKEYMDKFEAVMHHNVDKALLAAGEVTSRFCGGSVDKPMLLVLGDRATFQVGQTLIPVEDIAIETAKKWFRKNLRFVDPERHVRYQTEIRKGSVALTDIFRRKGQILGANDTSAGVGYAPMTKTERMVMDAERFLNSVEFKRRFPETGEDIKVMGLRTGSKLNLTVAMAFVDKYIGSEKQYFDRKNAVLEDLSGLVKKAPFDEVELHINTLDVEGRGIDGLYLTVLGTSADGADCGQVGRGNRVNGVISLNRPQSSEAAAGKNPVSHVGKIYNILSFRLAQEIFDEVDGLREVYVWLLSQIGQRIDRPKIAAAQVVPASGNNIDELRPRIMEVIESRLSRIGEFTEKLVRGEITVC